MLELKNVSKHFGQLKAVDNVSLLVEEGEIRGVIGPNGAGKTTLYNCITGEYKPTEGKVILRGEDITKDSTNETCKKGISRLYQTVEPFAELTTLENVMVGCAYGNGEGRSNMEDSREKALELLDFVGLKGEKNLDASELNIGQRKKLGLAKCLGQRPDLLLLDEPALGLNSAEMKDLSSIINKIHDRGVTLVVVEHRMDFVMDLVEKISVIHEGRLLTTGTPKEVQQNEKVVEVYLG